MNMKRIYLKPALVVFLEDTTSALLASSIAIKGDAETGLEGLVKSDNIWDNEGGTDAGADIDW